MACVFDKYTEASTVFNCLFAGLQADAVNCVKVWLLVCRQMKYLVSQLLRMTKILFTEAKKSYYRLLNKLLHTFHVQACVFLFSCFS